MTTFTLGTGKHGAFCRFVNVNGLFRINGTAAWPGRAGAGQGGINPGQLQAIGIGATLERRD